jgi:uncharacterized phiE125 gp8 family phage protein
LLKLKRITAPVTPAVSTADAKAHMRVEHSDEDTLIANLVAQATRWCEEEAELSFMTQSWRMSLDCFQAEPVKLRRPPVASVTSVQYYDEAGDLQTLADTEYQVDLDAEPALLALAPTKAWPTTQAGKLSAVRVVYVAGVDDAADLDERAVIAVKQLAAYWYENREAGVTGTIATELQNALSALLHQMWVGDL